MLRLQKAGKKTTKRALERLFAGCEGETVDSRQFLGWYMKFAEEQRQGMRRAVKDAFAKVARPCLLHPSLLALPPIFLSSDDLGGLSYVGGQQVDVDSSGALNKAEFGQLASSAKNLLNLHPPFDLESDWEMCTRKLNAHGNSTQTDFHEVSTNVSCPKRRG